MYTAATDRSMLGRTCVVTGATRGIGRATAFGLARRGATVVLMGRDPERAAQTALEIRRESGNDAVAFLIADLASFRSIRAAAAELERRIQAIHVLIHNAGVSLVHRRVSADGIELTLAVNHLAPFLLTHLLVGLLRAAAPHARVITVSSEFERWGRIRFDDLCGERHYSGVRAYTQSKLANVMFTYELADRLAGSGVTANCVYPGLVATDLLRERWWWRTPYFAPLWRRVFLTPEQGAMAALYAATDPELEGVSGVCIDRHGRLRRTSPRSYAVDERRRLWRVSEAVCGC
jgi:NAD(P)-dependent dehydrogenase (short-subunit alcohol dehydrogenase family)